MLMGGQGRPTLALDALAELIDDGAQREQGLVDGGALLHAQALRARLAHALAARQVHQRQRTHPHCTAFCLRFCSPCPALHNL